MFSFLMKGLLRDRSRSLFPLLIITAGVSLTVLLQAYMGGAINDMVETNARFREGHLKVLTRSYLEQQDQSPIELALTETDHWLEVLKKSYPTVNWQLRIHFGGLLDIPNEVGETLAQGSVVGMAVDLFSPESRETEYLNLSKALVKGKLPQQPGEILISDSFFEKLQLELGQSATLISSDMDGSMAVYNFRIAGTIRFGVTGLDRGAMVADIEDVQQALNMADAATEIFGYYQAGYYLREDAAHIAQAFNEQFTDPNDPFSPLMRTFIEGDFGQTLGLYDNMLSILISVFIFIMGIVLWNTGIMSGIRRYGELGMRLALGETKGHIYWTLILEALLLGVVGSILGTGLGLLPAYFLQEVGLDISGMLGGGEMSILMSDVIRAHINATSYWIGWVPGVFATVLGTLISGLVIYRRQTAELFKELEL